MTLQSPLSLPSNPQPDLFTDTMNMADSHVANIVNEILVCLILYTFKLIYHEQLHCAMKNIIFLAGGGSRRSIQLLPCSQTRAREWKIINVPEKAMCSHDDP